MKWKVLPVPSDFKKAKLALRLNAFGSLYYHTKVLLQRKRLVQHLHGEICKGLESDGMWKLLEMPRDHFKTTMMEGLTTWWALPFNKADEEAMRALGYDDAWIAWMKRCHDPTTSVLCVSETDPNAVRIGKRVDKHFQLNSIFRSTFPEIVPTSETWSNNTKQIKIPKPWFKAEGEGTFDYIGVGNAVQSTHYRRVIQDDLVGRDALRSPTVMEDTLEYHKLLVGAMDQLETEIVCGNRWAHNDLNGHIRENEKYFKIESHSALGGCCDAHPAGQILFPEEWTHARLEMYRARLGPYLFSHQFLNVAVLPEECIFKPEWVKFYSPVPAPRSAGLMAEGRHWMGHEVTEGQSVPDLDPNTLVRTMIADPLHNENTGRSRHAITVTGLDPDTDRVYLLDVWCDSRSYDDFFNNIYKLAERWGLMEFWLETVAAQKYCKYHIEYRNRVEKRYLKVRELRTDKTKGAKRVRIEALEPLFRLNRIWVRRDQSAFLDEYYAYPNSRTIDILDTLGYAPQTWNPHHARRIMDLVAERRASRDAMRSRTGY